MLNMQTLEQNDELISPSVSFRRSGSLMCPNPSLYSLSRRSFSYNKLPPRPINLTVIKLDGSSFGTCFFFFVCYLSFFCVFCLVLYMEMNFKLCSFAEIEVPKSGTVAQLKQGVEKAFSHLPKKGPGTVSWYMNCFPFFWLILVM